MAHCWPGPDYYTIAYDVHAHIGKAIVSLWLFFRHLLALLLPSQARGTCRVKTLACSSAEDAVYSNLPLQPGQRGQVQASLGGG